MTHTPGPWRKDGDMFSGDKHIALVVGGDDGQYPTIFIESRFDGPVEDQRFKANVALIIAAPEMEETLQMILKRVVLSNATADRIKAVLAKAAGEK